jgi:hypothetical protein
MKISEKTLKRLLWLVALPIAAAITLIVLRELASLFNYFHRAQVVDSALHLVEPRRAERNRITWLEEIDDTVREMETFSRDAITNDYMIAFEELTYSLYTGDQSGLESYFQSGALDDAKLATGKPAEFVDWNHQLKLHFYSLDGGTVGLTDTFDYAQGVIKEEDFLDMRLARRTMEVILKLDDGNWRIHHWRTLNDEVLKYSRKTFLALQTELSGIRGIRYVARSVPLNDYWVQPDAAELIADFSNITRLGFNTLEISLPYPGPENLVENFGQLVDLSSTYNLRVIVNLLSNYNDYQLEDIPKLLMYLDGLSEVLKHPNILAIRFNSKAVPSGMSRLTFIMRYLMQYTRDSSKKPILISDLALVADADAWVKLEDGPTNISESETGLPLLMYVGFNSNLLSLKPQGQQQQAYLYQMALEQARQQKHGWIVNALYDLPKTHGAKPHEGILEFDGTPKVAASVFLGKQVDAPALGDRIMDYRYILIVQVGFLVGLFLLGFWLRLKKNQQS